MLDSIYEAWRSDRDKGMRTLMIAGTGERVVQLNERARADLIEAAARKLLYDAEDAGTAWIMKLGQPSSRLEMRERWEAHAATVALYRHCYEITSPTQLGDAKAITTADQAAEYRAAQTVLARTRRGAQRPYALKRRRQQEIDRVQQL